MKKIITQPSTQFEFEYWQTNKNVAGIDEAGRGPLAGPVVASAVILPNNINIIQELLDAGLNDSKKISEKKRELLYNIITKNAISFGVGIIDNARIDEINILNATLEAMNSAINNLKIKPYILLIDGNYFRGNDIEYKTIIKGDAKSVSIASASIIAKVTRDKYMIDIADKLYPNYSFFKHKGYGTKIHIEAIKMHGICPIHRNSFLKNII